MKGSISVFACLLLASVIFLNCVLVDTAKVISVKSGMQDRAEMALDSVLAGFDTLLREHYGLFAISGGNNLKEVFSSYFSVRDTSYDMDSFVIKVTDDYLPVDMRKEDLFNVIIELNNRMTDTDVLKKQICQEMKIRTPVNLGLSILEKVKILSGSGKMSEACKKQAEITSIMNEVTENIETLHILVEGKYSGDIGCANGYDMHKRYLSYVELLQSGYRIIKAGNKGDKALRKAVEDMKDAVLKMKVQASVYLEYNIKAIEQINILSETQSIARVKIRELDVWLSDFEPEDELDMYYKQTILQQKNELKKKADIIGNTHLLAPLNKNAGILSRIISASDSLLALMDIPEGLLLSVKEIEVYICNLDNKGIYTDMIVHTCSEYFDKSYIEFDPRSKAENELKGVLKEYKNASIPTDLYKTLPSIIQGFGAEGQMLDAFDSGMLLNTAGTVMNILSLAENFKTFSEDPARYVKEGIFVDDYIMTFFDDALSGGTSGDFFKSEVEYIIGGSSSESINRLICESMILCVRFMMNMIHIMCDAEKRALADNIGNAIAGSISYGIGGPLYATLVIAGWSFCESVIDIKGILEGKEVPLLKRKTDWKFSIQGLAGSASDNNIEDNAFFNLDYRGYLRIFLAFMGQRIKLLRICDLIELNMTHFLSRRYYLSGMYTSVKAKVTICAEVFASTLLFVPDDKKENDGFLITGVYHAGY